MVVWMTLSGNYNNYFFLLSVEELPEKQNLVID